LFDSEIRGKMQMYLLKEISTLEQWRDCLAASNNAPLFIFKHSTQCSISSLAHDAVTRYLAKAGEAAPQFVLVKVIESRSISNTIAEELSLEHKSPQLILVKAQKAIWSASHYGINVERIESVVNTYATS
jgi:bacillithiol system protein YtxJ